MSETLEQKCLRLTEENAELLKRLHKAEIQLERATSGLPATTPQGDMLPLEKRIQGIKKDWGTALTYAEMMALANNRRALESITPDQWALLKRFMWAKLDQAEAYWQPRTRSKFIETIGDVIESALRWDRKQPNPTQPDRATRQGHWK